MEHGILKITGMSCEHCVQAVTSALATLPGVSNIAVDLDGGCAAFDYDPAKTTLNAAADAVEDQGFEAEV